ncbi:MAG TPA: tryptophan 7-halogenase, partial [Steroidobacteraceae bacterium]|nr:tryptophan 7-halogenase [Steroidobacteraceae bacterium]
QSIAHDSGWRWRIPLQHRVGNGLVFASKFLSDDAAKEELVASIDGRPLTAPRVLKFQTGRRRQVWNKNVIALGLSSGFIEPLESTSIHLMMVGVTRLLHLFPSNGITQGAIDQYNEMSRVEMEKTRDFVVLHYHATQRDDSAFWRHCRDMPIPDSLRHRIEMFRETAYAWQADAELFRVDSWTQVMLGQGIRPKTYHPAARVLPDPDLTKFLADYRAAIAQTVARMPVHQDYVNQYCRASNSVWN